MELGIEHPKFQNIWFTHKSSIIHLTTVPTLLREKNYTQRNKWKEKSLTVTNQLDQ